MVPHLLTRHRLMRRVRGFATQREHDAVMPQLILIRHGESEWNRDHRFTGWADVGLTEQGRQQMVGAATVQRWRRSFDEPPPQGPGDGDGHPIFDERYAGLPAGAVPQGESLAQVVTRVVPVWTQCLQPALATGQRVLVTAHGNSLRALIKLIEGIADADIARLEIPNAVPMLIELDARMRLIGRTLLGPVPQAPSEIL